MPRYAFANPYGSSPSNPNAAPLASGINNIATAFFGDPKSDPYEQEKDQASARKNNLEAEALQRKQGAATNFYNAVSNLPPEKRNDAIASAAMHYIDQTGDVDGGAKIARAWAAITNQDDETRANTAVGAGQTIQPTESFSLKGQATMRDNMVNDKIREERGVPKVVPEGGQLVELPPAAGTVPAVAAGNGFNAPTEPPLPGQAPPTAAPQQVASAGQLPASTAPSSGVTVLYQRPRRPEPIPDKVQDDITGMLRLHDNLTTIDKNKDVFGPLEGRARQMIPGSYGGNQANDAYAAQGQVRADVQSVIKGIPSNYDARIFENTLPQPGDGEDLIAAKKKVLDRTIELGLRNTVANYQGTKQEISPAILKQITDRGIDLDNISRMDNSPETLSRDADLLAIDAAKLGGRNPEDYRQGQKEQVPAGWDPEDYKYLTPEEKAQLGGKQPK